VQQPSLSQSVDQQISSIASQRERIRKAVGKTQQFFSARKLTQVSLGS